MKSFRKSKNQKFCFSFVLNNFFYIFIFLLLFFLFLVFIFSFVLNSNQMYVFNNFNFNFSEIFKINKTNLCDKNMTNSDYDNFYFKKGDILVKKYIESPNWNTFSTSYHHVAIVSKSGYFNQTQIVEAIGSCEENFNCSFEDDILISDMKNSFIWNKFGVKNIGINNQICNKAGEVLVLEVINLSEFEINKVVSFAKKIADSNAVYKISNNKNSLENIYCSQLIYLSFKSIGLNIDNNALAFVTPDDILKDDDIKIRKKIVFES